MADNVDDIRNNRDNKFVTELYNIFFGGFQEASYFY